VFSRCYRKRKGVPHKLVEIDFGAYFLAFLEQHAADQKQEPNILEAADEADVIVF